MLLSKDFLRAVGIALLMAIPISWWMMQSWLNGFAWHINLGADIFLVTGVSVAILTVVTVSFQVVSAAIANPVKSLDSE